MNKQFVKALFASTCFVAASSAWVQASHAAAVPSAIPVAADGIGGVVTSAKGPEAGVWVIAQTHELPTRLIKIVVTDDQGRYYLPELPKAKYDVWVRGYGLVDSRHVEGTPGKNMNLTAVVAPDAKAAAEYYPANYWLSLLKMPAESEFPGTGPKGNGIAPSMQTQQMWVYHIKNCMSCHQHGDKTTRTLLDNTPEGWAERITKARPDGDHVLGDHGKDFAAGMQNSMTGFGRARGLNMWADYSKRIAAGELPHETPPRPSGAERNIVMTSWDWANGRYVHDNVQTDRHEPTVNANGPIYGVIGMMGYIVVLDPMNGKQEEVGYKVTPNEKVEILPSDKVPDAFPHNPMMDRHGNIWVTDLGRYGAPKPGALPAPDKMGYCTDPANKYAKYYPQAGKTTNTLIRYDTKAKTVEGIPMCNGMHHLGFQGDRKTLYLSGGGSVGGSNVVSWVDIDVWAATHDPQKSMGWCPMVVDSNADGKITPDRAQWNVPARGVGGGDGEGGGGAVAPSLDSAPFDPKKDTRIEGHLYGMDADLTDSSMWYSKRAPFPNGLVRFNQGSNPPETCKTEFYNPPKLADGKSYEAFHLKGMGIDSKGVAWAAYSNGRLGKLDRKKCKVSKDNAAIADGQQCPEGWTFYDTPGPKMMGAVNGSADYHYYMWVDLHDTLGFGKDVPIVAGSNSDSLVAFDQKSEKFNIMRVPYPMAFHTRGMDGRIDNAGGGWKGRGLYATYASEPVWHQEGGEDASGPQIVKFQVRPSPIAN